MEPKKRIALHDLYFVFAKVKLPKFAETRESVGFNNRNTVFSEAHLAKSGHTFKGSGFDSFDIAVCEIELPR